MATYTTQNPRKVERLVLYAPGWIRQTASLVQAGPGPLARLSHGDARAGAAALDDRRAGRQEGDASSRPAGSTPGPTRPSRPIRWARRRARRCCARPTAWCQDSNEYWSAGKAYYDPAKITVPTLLVQAEWDRDLPPYMAQTLFPLLVNSPGKRYVMLPEGTHTIIMEKNRLMLFEAVQQFLDEASRS